MRMSEELESPPQIEQPGLSRLREAVANARQALPGRATLVQDGLAGVNSTIGSAPDAMANAILAGVNPLYGLYAAMLGPAVGALFTSTQLMIISSPGSQPVSYRLNWRCAGSCSLSHGDADRCFSARAWPAARWTVDPFCFLFSDDRFSRRGRHADGAQPVPHGHRHRSQRRKQAHTGIERD